MDKRSVGIRSIIPTTRSPEEIRSDELEEFYKNDIEGKTYTPRITPEIDTLELPSINLTQLESSKETKDKAINSYLTRPPDNIKKMVEKNMPILTYIDKVSNIYDGKPRQYDDQGKPLNNDKTVKQLTALKEFGKNPYTYKSKLETLVEPKQLSMDFGTDQYGNIPGPTDRIQDQARKKEIEIRNKNRARNATKEKTDV